MKHIFSSAKSDSGDATLVRPSNWNALHIYETASISANTTLDGTHDLVLATSGAGGITVTLPTAVGITGRTYTIKKVDTGAGAVTIDADGTETIDGGLTYVLRSQWAFVEIVSNGTNWVVTNNSAVDVQVFTGNGTWAKPSGAQVVQIYVIGGGGGGGSGRRGAAGTTRGGGSAGSGAASSHLNIPASVLGATEDVVVGLGGTGGAASTTDNTNGNAGLVGGTSSFGTRVSALGGNPGQAGTTSVPGATSSRAANYDGILDGTSSNGGGGGSGGSATDSSSFATPRGGGGGGELTAGDVEEAGGTGGGFSSTNPYGVLAGGTAGTSGGGNGGNGNDRATNYPRGGSGGGGGGSESDGVGAGGTGGSGGLYGAGGGGGGASANGANSGAGGNGGNGIVVVITYL